MKVEKITTKKSWTHLAAIALALSLATKAHATINAVATFIPLDATLTSNGWIGIQISLVASIQGETVAGFDFANAAIAVANGVTGTVGISGPIEQKWISKKSSGAEVLGPPTSIGGEDVEVDPTDPTTNPDDSYWYNAIPSGNSYASIQNLFENNNLANLPAGHTNQVDGYNASPETDVAYTATKNGVDYGVGSLMTLAATINIADQTSSLDIAFVITPISGTGTLEDGFITGIPITFKGVAIDNFGTVSPISSIINTDNVPEPASLGILAVGSVGLLLRRKVGSISRI